MYKTPIYNELPLGELSKKQTVLEKEFDVSLFPIYQLVYSITGSMKVVCDSIYPDFALLFESGKMSYLGNKDTWVKISKEFIAQIIRDPKLLYEIQKIIEACHTELVKISSKFSKVRELSNQKLWTLFDEYLRINQKLYDYGLPLIFVDYQYSSFLSDYLKNYLRRTLDDESKINAIYLDLTAPTQKTLLLKYGEGLTRLTKKISYAKKGDKLIKDYLKKWAWINYGYQGKALNQIDILKQLKTAENLSGSTNRKVEFKKVFLKRLRLSSRAKLYIEILRLVAFLKPQRKLIQSKGYFLVQPLFSEISRRIGVDVKSLRYFLPFEIKTALLKRSLPHTRSIQKRYHSSLFIKMGAKNYLITDKSLINKYVKEHVYFDNLEKKLLKGNVAFMGGKINGFVRIVNTLEDALKFKRNEILVSHSTNPSLLQSMLMSKGVITDMGGVTSHASIVAREFKIPTIVGVQTATQVLKDGNLIEMDTNNGTIRIIEKV